jgi:hypothetical protein
MRDRHLPRLCRSCQRPMARQEAACWHCGDPWTTEDSPRTVLRLIPGGAGAQVVPHAEQWFNEGGALVHD